MLCVPFDVNIAVVVEKNDVEGVIVFTQKGEVLNNQPIQRKSNPFRQQDSCIGPC